MSVTLTDSGRPFGTRINAVRRDLVALGPMAPVRAAYEVAKRSGAHGAVLRRFVAGAHARPLVTLPAFELPTSIPPTAQQRALADAKAIVGEGHRVFGQRFPVEQPLDWTALPGTDLSWPAAAYWWDIDIRTEQRLGDVKWTWELGRHRDLVVLARAAALEPDGPWLEALESRLRGWFEISAPEVGIHWYSNLEIALRVIAWAQIFSLVGTRLEPVLVSTMEEHVAGAERHLIFDFPYTASSMRNNHLLGDALGIIVIDRFTGGDGSRRPARLAERFFADQLARHMKSDGSMIEDSLSYHRFVMEMLVVKVLLGDTSSGVVDALHGSAAHLVRMGALVGPLPQWGDWDEGRVLASSGDALDVEGTTRLALSLTDAAASADAADFDELAWYGVSSSTVRRENPPVGGTSGGITHVHHGPWRVWFKVDLEHSHQHADLGHVSIEYDGQWVVVDPGTGTYNGPLEIRNAFRTSGAHNGVRVDGSEILTPHRAFRWLGDPQGQAAPLLAVDDVSVAFSSHDAFVEGHECRVARAVVVSPTAVTCVDWLERRVDSSLTLALAPELDWSGKGIVGIEGLELRGLDGARVVRGSVRPFAGWNSTTYGEWSPATWIDLDRGPSQVTWWSVAQNDCAAVTTNGREVEVDGLALSAQFEPECVTVNVRHGDRDYLMRTQGDHS